MRQGAQLARVRHMGLGLRQGVFLRQRLQRGFARTQKTPGHEQRHRIQHGGVHGTLFLVQTPAVRPPGQSQQRGQGAQSGIQRDKTQRQQQQHQVQRQIDAVRRPKQRHRALVAAGKQRRGHSHAKQHQKPQGSAHIGTIPSRP